MKDKGKSVDIKTYDKARHDWIIEHNCSDDLIEQGYNDLVEIIK